MDERILFVDDDPNLLAALQRRLRGQFRVEIARSAKDGLETVSRNGPYAVVVSDFRMPEMNGIQFLSRVREIAPQSIRILLTGYADIQTAIRAVNEGNIFRLLTKPCPDEILLLALASGIEQYRLVTAERELLEKTLSGCIRVLTEILSLLNPVAFGRATRSSRYAREIALEMGLPQVWQVENAAMLSQIGCLTLPEETLGKIYRGEALTPMEHQLYMRHPLVAAKLLSHIPRMQDVIDMIASQERRFDGSGSPEDSPIGEAIPIGARILKVVLDFDALTESARSNEEALGLLKGRSGWYDPKVLAVLEAILFHEPKHIIQEVSAQDLAAGMVLAEDLCNQRGVMLLSKGHRITAPILERLRQTYDTYGLKEPIRVLVALNNVEKNP